MLTDRVNRVAHSPTLSIAALAAAMKADGADVLDFSVGQPDFPTPTVAREAGKHAIDQNRTGYTASEGILELRAAIAAKLLCDNGLEYDPKDILVSPGAKASLYFLAMALFQEGDEVVVPLPYWVSYPEQIALAGATPVFLPTREDNAFKVTAPELASAITPRTKAVILNYPSNPTGSCYDADELAGLAGVCLQHSLVVVSDEIYEKLLYDGRRFTSIAALSPEVKARTVVINGMSKSYSMTGWRLGYAAGPHEIIDGMAKVQSHSTSNPTSIAQWAGLAALREADDDIEHMRTEFEARRDLIVRRLHQLPGITCVRPAGAFYVFPNVSTYLRNGRIGSALELAGYLLEEARVAVVPGEAFGSDDHLRLSYACSLDKIEEGMDRLGDALKRLRVH